MFITIAPQHLKTIILLHTICFSTSPLVNRTCNFAGWQLGCCEFDEREGTLNAFVYQKTNQRIYTFILMLGVHKILGSSSLLQDPSQYHYLIPT